MAEGELAAVGPLQRRTNRNRRVAVVKPEPSSRTSRRGRDLLALSVLIASVGPFNCFLSGHLA